jgi:hypothetical protein
MGAKIYTTSIDMWSAGCIFAGLLLKFCIGHILNEHCLLNRLHSRMGKVVWSGKRKKRMTVKIAGETMLLFY